MPAFSDKGTFSSATKLRFWAFPSEIKYFQGKSHQNQYFVLLFFLAERTPLRIIQKRLRSSTTTTFFIELSKQILKKHIFSWIFHENHEIECIFNRFLVYLSFKNVSNHVFYEKSWKNIFFQNLLRQFDKEVGYWTGSQTVIGDSQWCSLGE